MPQKRQECSRKKQHKSCSKEIHKSGSHLLEDSIITLEITSTNSNPSPSDHAVHPLLIQRKQEPFVPQSNNNHCHHHLPKNQNQSKSKQKSRKRKNQPLPHLNPRGDNNNLLQEYQPKPEEHPRLSLIPPQRKRPKRIHRDQDEQSAHINPTLESIN